MAEDKITPSNENLPIGKKHKSPAPGISAVPGMMPPEIADQMLRAAENNPMGGARPFSTAPPASVQKSPAPPSPAPSQPPGSTPASAEKKLKGGQRSVLIVEDNPMILRITEIMLAKKGFTVHLANNGRKAIQSALMLKPDIMLLDLGLPELSGEEVISTLKKRKITASIPVIVFTASNDPACVLRIIKMGIEDYLVKPVNQETLLERVEKVLTKHGLAMPSFSGQKIIESAAAEIDKSVTDAKDKTPREKIERIIAEDPGMMALPFVISKVLKITGDDNAGAKELAKAISSDTAITAAVLRRANSATFGKHGKIADITEAIVRMGVAETRGLVLGLNFVKFLSGKGRIGGLDTINFWKHSHAVGTFSRLLAVTANYPNTEVAFTAGLLHDLGKIIFAEYLPAEYNRALKDATAMKMTIRATEESELGITHQVIGQRIAEKWQLPEEIIEVIRHHHTTNSRELGLLTQIVHLADALAKAASIGHAGDLFFEYTPIHYWKAMNNPKGIDLKFIKRVTDELVQAREFLEIPEKDVFALKIRTQHAGDVLLADIANYPEQIIKVFLKMQGFHIINLATPDQVIERLTEKHWAALCIVLDDERQLEFFQNISQIPNLKNPGRILCFHTPELKEKCEKSKLPYEFMQMPCEPNAIFTAFGIDAAAN